MQPPPKPKRPIYARWWAWVVGAIALLVIIAAIGGGGGDQVATPQAGQSESAVSEPAASGPADTEKPAEEPKTEAPEPDGADQIGDKYGTFKEVSKSGSGDATIKLPEGARAGMVTASHKGSANFAISALDAGNQPTGDLLVNTIGSYSGVTDFGLSALGEAVKLKIVADGSWKIKIESLAEAPQLKVPEKGEGDEVFLYLGTPADWAITNKGDANFVVVQYADFPNLLVNEIGDYKGTVPVNGGPTVVTIKSDGDWTVKNGG